MTDATQATCPPQEKRLFYDYFLKDHLGNVRTVVTEQQEYQCYPAATVETATVGAEKMFYNIVDTRVVNTTGNSPASFQAKQYEVRGGTANKKTGLGIVLKVMTGDEVAITVESNYQKPASNPTNAAIALTELLGAFVAGPSVTATKGVLTTTTVSGIGTNTTLLNNMNPNAPLALTPKAFFNWVLFDEQLKVVSSGADAVESSQAGQTWVYTFHDEFFNNPVVATKNGFLYVYVSNYSNTTVYFDNLKVTHTPEALIEETSYYPFGMTMQAISSIAIGVQPTTVKFFIVVLAFLIGCNRYHHENSTKPEFINNTPVSVGTYETDSLKLVSIFRTIIKQHIFSFSRDEYYDSTELIIDTILYDQTQKKIATFVLSKNPVHRNPRLDSNSGYYYNGNCYLGKKVNADSIVLLPLGPYSFNYFEEISFIKKALREDYFTRLTKLLDSNSKQVFEYNLDDKRFWTSKSDWGRMSWED